MPSSRAPWWVYILILCFGSFFLFVTYLQVFPLTLRITLDADDGVKVANVIPGGPAAAAGLRPGDRIISYNGRGMERPDQFGMAASYEPGKPVVLEIQRDNQRLMFSAIPRRFFIAAPGSDPTTVGLILYGRLALTFYLISGIGLLLARPRDRLVLVLAVAYLLVADFAWPIPAGFSASFRNLPAPAQAVLWVPLFIESVLLAFLGLWFSLTFPRPLLPKRWIGALVAPSLLFAPAHLLATYRLVYQPGAAVPFFYLAWPGARIELPVFGAAEIVFFALNYLRLQDANERRRVRLVTVGMLMVLASCWSYLGPTLFFPRSAVANWVSSTLGILVLFTFFAAAPFVVGYAVIRHRLFDVHVMVRQGLRYAAARGVLLGLVPAAVGLLVIDLALHHREPLGEIIAQRGWLYAVIAAMAFAAHAKRQQWMAALDRRFFRERYNAQQILREIVEEVRGARSLDAVAPRTVARIENALHPEFVGLMVRDPNQPIYSCHAGAPAGVALPVIASDSKLMAAFRLFARPLEISLAESNWLKQQLPHSDTEFLRQTRIDLMVPISLSVTGREALLLLGRKRSEEPYSAEDRELLLAIADSLALLLERPAAAASSSGLEECPRCGSCYDSGMGRCSQDGSQLAPSLVPRLLTSRYRLDRRLGRGGMGTVYSALDTSLERQVALKLIREELVSSSEATERFRREARAAAAITHPNLATLYDFAVDAGNRAFLVMELLSGATLRQQLQQQGRLPSARVLEIVRGVCSALALAHQRGLVHRDLKPENIFLACDNGRDVPKILDFGLAKFVGPGDAAIQATVDTGAGVLLGTPQYMSPEQLKGQPAAAHWDLWALAVISYEMLAGAYPFGSPASVAALHNAILGGQFAPIQSHLPGAPAKWQEFFMHALHPEPSRRPASAAEFLETSEQMLTSASAQSAD